MGFAGHVELEATFEGVLVSFDAARAPTNADSTPVVVIYGEGGSPLVSATVSQKHTGSVTGATNASPIVITSANHGLVTGERVTVASVGGNTAANGTFTITKVDANSFSLNSSTGNGAYTSGGTWNVSGLYKYTVACTGANGFERGKSYRAIGTWAVGSSSTGGTDDFEVY